VNFFKGSFFPGGAGSCAVVREQFAGKSDAGKGPIALHRAWSDVKELGNFLDGETAEISQLDHAGLAGTLGLEASERLVDCNDFIDSFGGYGQVVVDLHAVEGTSAALGMMGTGVVDQDLAHHMCSNPNKVGTVVPVDVPPDEPKVSLIDEGGRLEGMVRALAPHGCPGETV